MGENLATWEMVALGAIALVVILLFFPGLKKLGEESRKAKKDWSGLLLPIGAVVLFVILLVLIV
jgi:hypothetical protein